MSWQSELVAFSALMFTVILELSFVTIFGILFAFLLSSFWNQKEERGEGSYCSVWILFTTFSSMPGHLQTGTSLYFQRTNTVSLQGLGKLPGFFEDENLGVSLQAVQSYKQSLCFQPLLCITASNSWAILGFWGLRQLAYLCFSQFRQKCCVSVSFSCCLR